MACMTAIGAEFASSNQRVRKGAGKPASQRQRCLLRPASYAIMTGQLQSLSEKERDDVAHLSVRPGVCTARQTSPLVSQLFMKSCCKTHKLNVHRGNKLGAAVSTFHAYSFKRQSECISTILVLRRGRHAPRCCSGKAGGRRWIS